MAGLRRRMRIAATAGALLAHGAAGTAVAADIWLLYAVALEPVFHELLPQFEAASGHEVAAQHGPAGAIAERIRKGEAVDFAGPLPAEVQNYTRFAAVVAAGTENGEAAAALVRYLAAPAAQAAMRAKGFEP